MALTSVRQPPRTTRSRRTAPAPTQSPGSLVAQTAAWLHDLCPAPGARAALTSARARAELALAAGGETRLAEIDAALTLAAETAAALALEGRWHRKDAGNILRRLADESGTTVEAVASQVYCKAARAPQLAEIPPLVAIETILRLLTTLPHVSEASVWTRDPTRRVTCIVRVGPGRPARSIRLTARRVLDEAPDGRGSAGLVQGFVVTRWHQAVGALVVRTTNPPRQSTRLLGEETALIVAGALARQDLLERGAARERALVAASERRLTRFGLDLHDGPIQDMHAVVGDLRLFRCELAEAKVGADLLTRVDDFAARLLRVDQDVRELARSFESIQIAMRPLHELVAAEVESLRRDAEIEAVADVRGDLDDLTASQQLALIRIVQEALTNAREHSGASRVSIAVARNRTHVHAEIRDDGCGFVVEQALARAARAGRLGLIGMSERVRLLGGAFDVESRPGGPTTISVTLPLWRPLPARGGAALAGSV